MSPAIVAVNFLSLWFIVDSPEDGSQKTEVRRRKVKYVIAGIAKRSLNMKSTKKIKTGNIYSKIPAIL